MLFEAFRPPKPENRILLRYPLDGHGYIFSCTVNIFHPQGLCKVFELGLDRANEVELLFASPAFELFFPSDGCANVVGSRERSWRGRPGAASVVEKL
jgi:hypothetical protein